MVSADPVQIPSRSLFRQPEVCEIAQVQPYVLRSWEAEFKDLGVAKTQGGPRVYRRADVERVLRIKHLLFVEGLDDRGRAPEAAGRAAGGAVGIGFGIVSGARRPAVERRARADHFRAPLAAGTGRDAGRAAGTRRIRPGRAGGGGTEAEAGERRRGEDNGEAGAEEEVRWIWKFENLEIWKSGFRLGCRLDFQITRFPDFQIV